MQIVLSRGLRYSYAGRIFHVNKPQEVDEQLGAILLDVTLFDGREVSCPFTVVGAVVAPVAPVKTEKPAASRGIVVGGKSTADKVGGISVDEVVA